MLVNIYHHFLQLLGQISLNKVHSVVHGVILLDQKAYTGVQTVNLRLEAVKLDILFHVSLLCQLIVLMNRRLPTDGTSWLISCNCRCLSM